MCLVMLHQYKPPLVNFSRDSSLTIQCVKAIHGFQFVQWGFPKWGRTFMEFTEFRESDKSLKHELGSG